MDKSSDDLIQNTEDRRKPYEKPSLEVIHLTAGEVLGIGCKIMGGCTAGALEFGS